MTFLELVYETLKKHQSPLSIKEIWDKSDEYGYRKNLSTSGKTPVKTLEARLYLDIRDNPNSSFYQHSKRPSTFYIKNQKITNDSTAITSTQSKTAYNERDLHPLLTSFVYSDSHFKCVTKTIHHEKSKKCQPPHRRRPARKALLCSKQRGAHAQQSVSSDGAQQRRVF